MKNTAAARTAAGLHQPSLVELAETALRRRILSGDLAPGQRLVEERLTEDLGISRPPLREAMRLLEQDGLIVRTPRQGAQVAALTAHDTWEVLTLRHSLERLALTLAMPLTDDAQLAESRECLAAMESCAEEDNPAGMVEAGYRFHESLVRLGGNSRVVAVYKSLQAQLQLCMALNTQASHEALSENVARHRTLLAAVASGDLDRAVAGLESHGHGRFLDARREG